jgi:hypothetical protein
MDKVLSDFIYDNRGLQGESNDTGRIVKRYFGEMNNSFDIFCLELDQVLHKFIQKPLITWPMKAELSRRSFISRGSRACAACCLMLGSPGLLHATRPEDDEINPGDYTYCGYKCTPECPLLKATVENDTEQKKKVFEEWGVADTHGIEFNAEEYFCHGCKNNDKPLGFPVRHCTIIPCAREKGYEACFQCRELASCEKEIWVKYPQHREYVLGLQETYFATL